MQSWSVAYTITLMLIVDKYSHIISHIQLMTTKRIDSTTTKGKSRLSLITKFTYGAGPHFESVEALGFEAPFSFDKFAVNST